MSTKSYLLRLQKCNDLLMNYFIVSYNSFVIFWENALEEIAKCLQLDRVTNEVLLIWMADPKHSFFFGNYDANYMGFRNLRVINEDKVLPNQVFGTHGHRDMEIISYVISGSLEHRDR